jgi:F0F1-type ATP synthase assembly protein I
MTRPVFLQLRRSLLRLALLQTGLALALALLALSLGQGADSAQAAAFGGAVAAAGSLVILWYGHRAKAAGASLLRNASLIYGAAIVRFVLMAMLLAAGLAILRLPPLWLLLGLSAGLAAQLVLNGLISEKN